MSAIRVSQLASNPREQTLCTHSEVANISRVHINIYLRLYNHQRLPSKASNIYILGGHTTHVIDAGNFGIIFLRRHRCPIPTHNQVRAFWIKLRFIRNMQGNDLMPYNIVPRLQITWNSLCPQIWRSIPVLESALSPCSRLYGARQESALSDLKPVRSREIQGCTGGAAVCYPKEHGPNGVQQVVVYCCDVVACIDRDR